MTSLREAATSLRDNAVIPDEYQDYFLVRRVDFTELTQTLDAAPDPAAGSERLDDLRALSDAAAPGPWQWLDSGGDPGEHDELQDGHGEMVASGFREDVVLRGKPLNRDGSFAAAAVNYVRARLALPAATPEERFSQDLLDTGSEPTDASPPEEPR